MINADIFVNAVYMFIEWLPQERKSQGSLFFNEVERVPVQSQ